LLHGGHEIGCCWKVWFVGMSAFVGADRRTRQGANDPNDDTLRVTSSVNIGREEDLLDTHHLTVQSVIQQKPNRPVQFELASDVRATLLAWLEQQGCSTSDYLFPSGVDHAEHMSVRHYAHAIIRFR